MQFKQKLAYIALSCVPLFFDVVLKINVQAQALKQAQIAFISDRDGNYEIYVMDASGKNQRNLTNNPAADWSAAWSPDGRRIAFHSNRDGNWEIYIMDASGKNPRNLTNNPAEDFTSDWFDPAFAYPVSPAGKLRTIWGWLKQNGE
ncbi:TPA: hypothetical protein EYP66_24065 [Candidatus Poribacteria bacterium]|nr:hypothetical protein [Candidatus Poribacteria bacterium]